MQTVEIDENLMAEAMQDSTQATERAVVEAGLHLLIQMRAQENLRKLRGMVEWEGNLEGSRLGRNL